MPDTAVACSLAPEELADRIDDWRSLRTDALIGEQVEDGRLRSLYKQSGAERLRALVEAERRCCPSFEFTLREEADAVSLEVKAPAGREQLIALAPGKADAS